MNLFVLALAAAAFVVTASPLITSNATTSPSPRTNATASPLIGANVTGANMQLAGDSSNAWYLDTGLGHTRQHLGQLHGELLTLAILEALNARCPRNYGYDTCSKKEYVLGPVEYSALYYHSNPGGATGFWHNNAWIAVTVEGNNFPARWPGVRELMIDHVAQAFGDTSNLYVNCYEVMLRKCPKGIHAPGCRNRPWYRFCNAPDRVEVTLSPNSDKKNYPHLYVRMQFNGKTAEGKWDCVGSMSTVYNLLRPYRKSVYESIIDADVNDQGICRDLGVSGTCQNDDANVPMRNCGPW